MELTEREHHLIIAAYMNGYENGHNDTVESAYTDAYESGRDWLIDVIQDGGLQNSFKQVKSLWEEKMNNPKNI